MKKNWRECDKELPPNPGNYWIYYQYQDCIISAYWDGHQWEGGRLISVTHWTDSRNRPTHKPKNSTQIGINMGVLLRRNKR